MKTHFCGRINVYMGIEKVPYITTENHNERGYKNEWKKNK